MASVNKVIILGNLGRDPEIRYMPSGDAVANITVATTDRYKDKQTGENKEITEWHRISFFGRQAEVVGQYLRKGSQIYVEGSLRTRKWTDKDGQEKYSTEVRADNMQMLGGRQGQGAAGGANPTGGGEDDSYAYEQSQAAPAPRRPAPASRPPMSAPAPAARPAAAGPSGSGFEDMDDDIPF